MCPMCTATLLVSGGSSVGALAVPLLRKLFRKRGNKV